MKKDGTSILFVLDLLAHTPHLLADAPSKPAHTTGTLAYWHKRLALVLAQAHTQYDIF